MSAAPAGAPALRIDAWLDLICPWCLIGKRQLDQALCHWRQERPGQDVVLHWHSVRLVEGVPPQGWDFAAFYERRLGSAQAVRARQAQVLEAARRAGAHIDFDRIRVFPDTGPAHQLLAVGGRHLGEAAQAALIEDLLQAHFQRGQHLGDPATLLDIAQAHGLDPREVAAQLHLPLASDMPPSGVPFFVFNRRLALSGAQPPAALLAAMRAAQARPSEALA